MKLSFFQNQLRHERNCLFEKLRMIKKDAPSLRQAYVEKSEGWFFSSSASRLDSIQFIQSLIDNFKAPPQAEA